ncbi:MAG TPA: DUF302 domain-containing protein [Fimbriimonadaceae bacterium]|nr:DUF302 domain-containing protein [Fimbriimonadaceae bacterium]
MDSGLVTIPSAHSVEETLARLLGLLKEKGIEVFAVIDHDRGARSVGLEMAPARLVIFGNPKAGTPLMQAAPTAAIDLPLKILVWQDGQETKLTYNDSAYIGRRHGVPESLLANVAAAGTLAHLAAGP